jgi:ABC-type multidrug transport system fused ATPase/permease subunit
MSLDHLDGPSAAFALQHASAHDYHVAAPSLPSAREHPLFYVGVYAAIGLSTALVSVLSTATQYTGALRASRILFKRLLASVVRATMRWHDTTPAGRMLNRFSKVRAPWCLCHVQRLLILGVGHRDRRLIARELAPGC